MIPRKINEMMERLEKAGHEAYLVGGAVRDIELSVLPKDYDIFTNATGEKILKIFPKGVVIGGEERQEKILTVVVDDVEISQYRSNGERTKTGKVLMEHQATCDFTINSMAMDRHGSIIDRHNGQLDLKINVLRFVGNATDRIKEDPLRILRGIRFWTKYKGMKFDDKGAVLENVDMLDTLPKERIREELLKIIKYPKGIERLWCEGIIYKIFPECKDALTMSGGDHHFETVDEHMINAFNEACKITDNPMLRLACFLHDVGKGVTFTEEEITHYDKGTPIPGQNGEFIKKQTHFYEHENKGEDMMRKRLGILKFSKEDIAFITKLIRLHMYSYKVKPGKKSYIRFFNKLEEAKISIEDYVIMIYCDHQANMAKPRIKFGDFIKGNWLHKKYYEVKFSEEPMTVKDLKVSGKDVIKFLKIKPGPKIGEILNGLFEAVMDGELKNERADLLLQLKAGG